MAAILSLLAMFTVGAQSLRESDPPLILPREYVIGSGELRGAAHEVDEGYYTLGAVQVLVPSDGVTALRLRELVGRRVELVLREFPVKPTHSAREPKLDAEIGRAEGVVNQEQIGKVTLSHGQRIAQ